MGSKVRQGDIEEIHNDGINTTINIGTTTFYELINVDKLKYIINHYKQFEDIIKEQEKDMRRKDKNYNAYAVFQKLLNNVCNTFETSESVLYGSINLNIE